MELFEKHEERLKRARAAIRIREYWSAHAESPRAYGDEAPQQGESAFQDRIGRPFALNQPESGWGSGGESSPYGSDLGVTYPVASLEQLITAAETALATWGTASVEDRTGVCLEILERLGENIFEMAHAVMQTTGQPFLMAFQSGGPQALDRGLEAVAHTYAVLDRIPGDTKRWEKPQGRRDSLRIDKQWRVRPRGIAVSIAGSTLPTLNSYPGIFASLVAGNPVIVKPHPATILPLAIFVETARMVLKEAGHDPNTVLLAVDTAEAPIARNLAMSRGVGVVDYTGGSDFGEWLEHNVHHARVFTAKSAVNSVILDSATDLKAVIRELAVSLTMYSGQMGTSPQNVFIPASGIEVDGTPASFGEVVAGLTEAIDRLLADAQRAGDILGAIKGPATRDTIAAASSYGDVLLESRQILHPSFPESLVLTPVIVKVGADDRHVFMKEMFGPVIYVIATADTDESLDLAGDTAAEVGALNWLVYTTNEDVESRAIDAAIAAGVSVFFNLPGGLYVNEPAAFSDFHGTGANPAGNSSFTDTSFVADRFRVVGVNVSAT